MNRERFDELQGITEHLKEQTLLSPAKLKEILAYILWMLGEHEKEGGNK